MQLFRKPQSTVGLDIGSSMVKAVRMTRTKKGYVLDRFAMEPLEEGVVQAGEIRNPTVVARAAKAAVSRCKSADSHVVVALPNFSILTDVFVMDLRPEKQVNEAVMVEAGRISPFDLNEVEIDYAILERNQDTRKMKVLMVAAKQDIILSYVDFLNEAGLQPTIIDVDLFALANLFNLNYDVSRYASSIILNIGTESTVAAFLQNGIFHSSRDISVAGANFVRELQIISGMNKPVMHDILRGIVPPDLDAETVSTALSTPAQQLANAVEVAISYFQSSDNVENIDLILLTGGYARIPGLCNVLELLTGAEVDIFNPFAAIGHADDIDAAGDLRDIGATFAVAMGLGTRTY